MSDTLFWNELHLGHATIPKAHVKHGEYVRLVMDYPCQYAFMQQMFLLEEGEEQDRWKMWLQTDSGSYCAGTPEFSTRIGSMIRQRGLIANLSLRENLLLPFLYHGDPLRLQKAEDEVVDVAQQLGIASSLDEKAGERSTYKHALMSLARCMLAKPAIIVAQEVHVGMPPEQLERFREYSMMALAQLGAGLLYLTESIDEGSGLEYARTLKVSRDCQGEELK